MAEDTEEIPVGDMPPWVVEEAAPVSDGGDAGKNVRDATNGAGSATADSQLHGLNSYLNDIKNIVLPGSTAAEVGLNANDGLPLQATLDGTNANITSASSGGAMNIKTTGSENKKIKLGYGFNGYKTVQLKVNGQSQIQAQSQNLSAFAGGALSDNDIMWIISLYGAGESTTSGFTQCEWNVERSDTDNHGWTVGGWSITQRGNFEMLGKTYMPKHNFSADECKIIATSDHGSSTVPPNSDKAKLESLVSKLTNSKQVNGHGVPDNRDRDEDVINFIHATSDMFANTWYKSFLYLIDKYGFKTRLGLATIIRAIAWTGR